MYNPQLSALRAKSGIVADITAQGPTAFGSLLRNWYRAANYDAATGNWTSTGGSRSDTLGQSNATKRPAKTASNAAFGSKPTADTDGVNDDVFKLATPVMAIQPNTLGILFHTTGAGAGDYLVGQYASTSYQFYRADHTGDAVRTDPSNQSYTAAGVATPHLWLFSKGGTQLTTYKDGVNLGARTMNASSGSPTDFYLGSGGSGFVKASIAEVFAIDRAISVSEAVALRAWFAADGYPL